MPNHRLSPDAPCRKAGCTLPRAVDSSGKRQTHCEEHLREYRAEKFRAWYARQAASRDLTCSVDGCNEPRMKDRKGRAYSRCAEHHRQRMATKVAKAAKPKAAPQKRGRKVRLVEVADGIARQRVNGVVVAEVPLRDGRLHPGTVLVLKARGWKVQEAG